MRHRPIVQRRPMGGGPIPGLSSGSATALPRLRSPITSPGCFVTFQACHRRLCWSSAGGDGVLASTGNGVGDWPAIAPLPSRPRRQSNSGHVGKRYVLGRNQQRRLRPGNCVSWPRNAISQELISLMARVTISALCFLQCFVTVG